MALVFGRCCLAEDLPWTACGGRDWLWKGLRKDLKHLKGLRPGKRQAWTPLKAHGPGVWPLVFSGRVALDGLAGGEIGFGKACGSMVFGRWCLAKELLWMGLRGARLALERPAEGFKAFKGFEAGQTAGLNTFKSTWPWCLAAGV